MKKLPISKLNDFFSAVSKAGNKVYLPVDIGEGKGADYKLWSEGVELSKALNTNRSAKDFFFPQTENLFELKMDGKNIDVINTRTEAEDFVVFGVRACDVRSFEVFHNSLLLRLFVLVAIATHLIGLLLGVIANLVSQIGTRLRSCENCYHRTNQNASQERDQTANTCTFHNVLIYSILCYIAKSL